MRLLLVLLLLARSAEPVVFHNQFAVHVKGGARKADEVAARHGFVNVGQIGSLEDHYLLEQPRLRKRSAEESGEHVGRLDDDPEVEWFEQQTERRRVKRDVAQDEAASMPDPLFQKQWYLNHGAVDASDMNVQPAWRRGITGKGVVVTILDDGIQTNHPDLSRNYDPDASTDINGNDADPTPQDNGDNKHGTRCAGEVAAEAYNDICGVGIAYNASIGGVRMLDGLVNDAVEARALSLNPNHIDIYSASWGPEDDGKTVDGPGPLAKKAFIEGIKNGRRGKGSIFVWASGNGGRKNDNCNCDGYTNSIFTLSISSATQGGRKPWYLEECSSTLATTYSSGTPSHDQSITTVDQDERLRKDKICTSYHTGTSASAPIAAGICALALEANPNLSWRDMQHIVLLTANPKPLLHETGWLTNGVGRQYSLKFGYGLMDADAMVRLSQVWPGSGRQLICETDTLEPNVAIPSVGDEDVARVSITTAACEGTAKEIRYLEHVQCKVTLQFTPRGALHLVLTSPSGTKSSLLLPRTRDKTAEGFVDWPFLSVHFWGEPANGTWTLDVYRSANVPSASKTTGIIKKWKLLFYGTKESILKNIPKGGGSFEFLGDGNQRVSDGELEDQEEDNSVYKETDDYHQSIAPPEAFLNKTPVAGKDGCNVECKGGCGGRGPSADKCEACQHFNYGGVCLAQCPKGTYATVLGTCEPCNRNCLTCYGPLPTQCLSCKRRLLLDDAGRSSCVTRCPPGFRMSDDAWRCVRCPQNCLSCSEATCTKCRAGLVLSASGAGGCQAGCPSGFFPNARSSRCEACHDKCSTCTGPLVTQCSLCKENTFFYHRQCVPQCPAGFHPNRRIGECVPCPPGCAMCNSDEEDSGCSKCLPGYLLDGASTKQCVPAASLNCTAGTFRSGDGSGRCVPCHESCGSHCKGGTADGCLSCPAGHLLHISSCVDDAVCPQSTFPFAGRECRHCPHACKACDSLQRCTACHANYALSAKGTCVANCAPDEFDAAGICSRCHDECRSCEGPGADQCLTCPPGRLLFGGRCVRSCPRGLYESRDGLACLPCHSSCLTCFGGNVDQCTSCPAGRKLGGDRCVGCGDRQFVDSATGACSKCHSSCEGCFGPGPKQCTACLPPRHLNRANNACVPCCDGHMNSEECCQCDSGGNGGCLESGADGDKGSAIGGRWHRSFREDVIGSSSRSAFVLFCLAAALAMGTFLLLNWWRRARRRRRKRGVRSSRRMGKRRDEVPLMTMAEEDEDEEGFESEEESVMSNGNGSTLLLNGHRRTAPLAFS